MSDFFNPYKKSKKKIDVNKNQINNLGFFSITDSGKDSTIEYKRNEKEVEDYDYEENEDFSKKSDLGFAFVWVRSNYRESWVWTNDRQKNYLMNIIVGCHL